MFVNTIKAALQKAVQSNKVDKKLRILIYLFTVFMIFITVFFIGKFSSEASRTGSFFTGVTTALFFICLFFVVSDVYQLYQKFWPVLKSKFPILELLFSDYHIRTIYFTILELAWDLAFIVGNGFLAVYMRSIWFASIAAYYLLLGIMRYFIVSLERKNKMDLKGSDIRESELALYRSCGILLIGMTVVLMVTVTQMVQYRGGNSYPKIILLGIAVYTFTKIILAVRNLSKAKHESLLILTAKKIVYADALVSVLNLQASLLTVYATRNSALDIRFLNGGTGAVICTIILFMGLQMIYVSRKELQVQSDKIGKEF